MEIKSMSYSTIGGIVFTAYVKENDRLSHKVMAVPTELNELKSLLEARIGDTVDTINFQICSTQSLSQERLVINYKFDNVTFLDSKITLNISEMESDELTKYNDLKSEMGII